MALVKCKECGSEISTKAESCPKCGAKIKKKGMGCGSLLVIVILAFIVIAMITPSTPTSTSSSAGEAAPSTAPAPREVVSNSSWDASVRQVEHYLKSNLKDPDSYDGMEWSSVTKLDAGGFMVRHKYRAKNSFGGYIIENQIFTLDEKGAVIAVLPYE